MVTGVPPPRLQVTFRGDGELGELQAIATSGGQVKGKVINPAADPPLRPDGKLNVGAAVGAGIVAVVRSHPASASPYTGAQESVQLFSMCFQQSLFMFSGQCFDECVSWQLGSAQLACASSFAPVSSGGHVAGMACAGMTPIVSGEIAEDLARYLADSEQTQCALGLGVSIDRSTAVASAGGFLVQASILLYSHDLSCASAKLMTLSECPQVKRMYRRHCHSRLHSAFQLSSHVIHLSACKIAMLIKPSH